MRQKSSPCPSGTFGGRAFTIDGSTSPTIHSRSAFAVGLADCATKRLPAYALSSAGFRERTCSHINVGRLEQPVGHGRRSNASPGEAGHHRGEIVSPVEAVFEFSEVARHVLLIDRPVGSNNSGFDIPQCCIDPFEGGGTSGGSARAGLDDLMRTPRVGDGSETGQAITDDLALRIKPPLGEGRKRVIAEAGDPTQLQAHRFALGRGFDGGDERRLAGSTATSLATRAFAAEVGVIQFNP